MARAILRQVRGMNERTSQPAYSASSQTRQEKLRLLDRPFGTTMNLDNMTAGGVKE